MAIGAFVLPRNAITITVAFSVLFCVSIPVAKNGYEYAASWYVWIPILLGHAAVLALVGWCIWPQVSIYPKHAVFVRSHQSFTFHVKNDTGKDVYQVYPLLHIKGSYVNTDWWIKLTPPAGGSSHLGQVEYPGVACDEETGKYALFQIIDRIDAGQERVFEVDYRGNSTAELTAENPAVNTDPVPAEEPYRDPVTGAWRSGVEFKPPFAFTTCSLMLGPE